MRIGMGLMWALMAFYLFSLWFRPDIPQIPYSRFKSNLAGGNVSRIHVRGEAITGDFKRPVDLQQAGARSPAETSRFRTVLPSFGDDELMPLLEKNDVTIVTESSERSWVVTLLVGLLPWLLIFGFIFYAQKKAQERLGGGQGGIFGFAKSKAKRYDREMSQTRFDDVAGLQNAKNELIEIVDYLKEPDRFTRLGGKIPKGIMLAGPPGTGKTLMARAVAGEAGVPFFSISGSEFIEMFVGVGASRVRDMFETAKKNAPAIIFIDEIDPIGRTRGTGLGGGHDEREQTLNQILSAMDGFAPHESVIVLAATNRPDVLDPALVRPGRFDRRVVIDMPDRRARQQILEVHTRNVPIDESVALDAIARQTIGLSGADLENLVNEAALIAGSQSKEQVTATDFERSLDKLRLGVERDDVLSEDEKAVIACHEAGHALIAKLLPGTDPLKKVTIVPHGQALGVTEQVPEEDRHNLSRTYLVNRMAVMMGGRAAEQLVYEDVTSGAGDDLKQATQMARRMVCSWGMSGALGPVAYTSGEPHPFLGKELAEGRDHSEDTARMIDEEIRNLLREAEQAAKKCLSENRGALDELTRRLVASETLSDDEIDAAIQGEAPSEAACCVAASN